MRSGTTRTSSSELWDLPFGQPQIDPARLARAIVQQVADNDLDFRTRLLIRDSMNALRDFWGTSTFDAWLASMQDAARLSAIQNEDLGEPGFSTLARRLMKPTQRKTIEQFLRSLDDAIIRPQEVYIGGSSALILADRLSRHTDDIDVVDEIPADIRKEHELLRGLSERHGLMLTHFQSHFLPDGWRSRVHSLPDMVKLRVFLVDEIDIFVSKLFSNRERDQDDLRHLAAELDKDKIRDRVTSSGQRLLADVKFRDAAERNWFVLYGEPL
jgi:hypothetical protein